MAWSVPAGTQLESDDEVAAAPKQTTAASRPTQSPWTAPDLQSDTDVLGRPAVRKPLDYDPQGGFLPNTGRFLATGAIKALSHLPGAVGDVRELGQMGIDYGSSLLTGRPFPDVATENAARNKETRRVFNEASGRSGFEFPSGGELSAPIFERIGRYDPESGAGRVAMGAVESLTPGLGGKVALGQEISGFLPKIGEGFKNYFSREAAPQAVSGAAGSAAGEVTGDPALAMAAGMTGAKVSSAGPRIVEAFRSPTRMGDAMAGQQIREAATDLPAVRAALERTRGQSFFPSSLFPGMKANAFQQTRDPGLLGLEGELGQPGSVSGSGSSSARTAADVDRIATNAAFPEGARNTAESIAPGGADVFMGQAYGVNSGARSDASRSVHGIYSAIRDRDYKAQDNAWKALPTDVKADTNSFATAIEEGINKLEVSDKNLLAPFIETDLAQIVAKHPNGIPLNELQKLRSRIRGQADMLVDQGDKNAARVHGDIAEIIRSNLQDPSLVDFGSDPSSISQWNNARALTKSYHDTHDVGIMSTINAQRQGQSKVSDEAMLAKVLSGADAGRNLETLQQATGPSINSHVENFLIGNLTDDGGKIVSPQQVRKFVADNHDVLRRIPGARDRLMQIGEASGQNQLATNISNAQSPQKILSILEKNRSIVNEFARSNPVAARLLMQLEASANYMNSASPAVGEYGILEGASSGSMNAPLYGKSVPAMLTGAGGLGLAALQRAGVDLFNVSAAIGILGGGSLLNAGARRLSGKVPEATLKALQGARRSPAEMLRLMNLPPLEKLPSAAPATVLGGLTGRDAIMTEDEREKRMSGRADGGRAGYRAGGRIMNHAAQAETLVRAAETAKKRISQTTEPLLEMPDEAVVKALSVANENI